MERWQSLTHRERLLVSVAATLFVAVLTYFALVRPLVDYHRDSVRELSRAVAVYENIAEGAAEVKTLGAKVDLAGAKENALPLRVAVSQAARSIGVAISRLQPGEDGALTVWVESVPSPLFYQWMNLLVAEQGVAVSKVMMQKSTAEGRLRVQVQFMGQL